MPKVEIKLYAARGLVYVTQEGKHDPSVKLTVSQVTSLVSSPPATTAKKKPVNPHWGQCLFFDVPDPANALLFVQVFDTNDNGQPAPIGEVWIPLVGAHFVKGQEDIKWYNLHKATAGEIKVGITPIDYQPPGLPTSHTSSFTSSSHSTPQTGYPPGHSSHSIPPTGMPPSSSSSYSTPPTGKPSSSAHSTPPSGMPPSSSHSIPPTGMPPSSSGHHTIPPTGFPPGMTPPVPRAQSGTSNTPSSSSPNTSSSSIQKPSSLGHSAPAPPSSVSAPSISRSETPSGYPPGYTPSQSANPSSHSKPPSSSSSIPTGIPLSGSGSSSASPSISHAAPSSSHSKPPSSSSSSIPTGVPLQGVSSPTIPHVASPVSPVKPPLPSTSSPAHPPQQPQHPSSLLRAESAGPYKQSQQQQAQQPQKQRKGLTAFAPTDLQRDYPHLAKGSYGIVYKGKATGYPNQVVIKDMEIRDQKSVNDWKKELQVMSAVSASPYIADIYGYSTQGTTLTIVMEYFPKGDLYGILYKKKEPLSMLQRMRMARHVALGVAFLHQNHFLHRDIKSMNILVAEDHTCKLTDFGCAKLVSDRQIYNTVNSGTPLWMAPEVKRGQYSFSADVYSMGLVLYELFEKQLPNYDQFQGRVVLPPSFQSASVIMPCLSQVPEQRPQAAQVVTVLDKMIKNVVSAVKDLLPKDEQEKLKKEAVPSSGNEQEDSIENELMQLYRHLLHKPASEVDAMISKAFGIQIAPQKSAPNFAQAPAPQPMQYGIPGFPGGIPGAMPMGLPMGIPQGMPGGIPGMPGGIPMGGVPMGGVPMGVPGQVPQGFPPNYY